MMKVVRFVDIFPMALVSFNLDYRLGDINETVLLFHLENLCAETVFIVLTYLEAEFTLGAVTKVVGNFL